jgi:hypothetical protein
MLQVVAPRLLRIVVGSRFDRESGTVFLEIRETAKLWELVRCPEEGGLVFCKGVS